MESNGKLDNSLLEQNIYSYIHSLSRKEQMEYYNKLITDKDIKVVSRPISHKPLWNNEVKEILNATTPFITIKDVIIIE